MTPAKLLSNTNIYKLERLRPTGLQMFEECPSSWAAKYLVPGAVATPNKYAKVGTAYHTVIQLLVEQFTTNKLTEQDREKAFEEAKQASLNDKELEGLTTYCIYIRSLLENGYKVVLCEYKFMI